MLSAQQNGDQRMPELEQCFFCREIASSERGTAYYRAQLPDGKWDSVPICLRCLLNKKRLEEDKKLGINELNDN